MRWDETIQCITQNLIVQFVYNLLFQGLFLPNGSPLEMFSIFYSLHLLNGLIERDFRICLACVVLYIPVV